MHVEIGPAVCAAQSSAGPHDRRLPAGRVSGQDGRTRPMWRKSSAFALDCSNSASRCIGIGEPGAEMSGGTFVHPSGREPWEVSKGGCLHLAECRSSRDLAASRRHESTPLKCECLKLWCERGFGRVFAYTPGQGPIQGVFQVGVAVCGAIIRTTILFGLCPFPDKVVDLGPDPCATSGWAWIHSK